MGRLRNMAAFVVVVAAWCGAAPAAPDAEAKLAAELTAPDTPPQRKDQICQALKRTGTASSVPALAALLVDEKLSHSARLALESMPCPEAGAALREAVGKTKGPTRVGIIDSLGERREKQSAAVLKGLLLDGEAAVAASAAVALGKIAGPEALAALQAAAPNAPPALKGAIADAMLRCAGALLAAGDAKAAGELCRQIYDGGAAEPIRLAACRGMIAAAGDGAAALIAKGLAASDRAAVRASLRMVQDVKGEQATKALAAVLPNLPAKVQLALLAGLEQRGDGAAAADVRKLLECPAQDVRLAAIRAVGVLGGAADVPSLAKLAAAAPGGERQTAREALLRLRGPDVGQAIVAEMEKAPPAARAELVAVLGERGDPAGVPVLLKLASQLDEPGRIAALRSLAGAAGDSAVEPLVALLTAARTDAERAEAAKALLAVCTRSTHPEQCAGPVAAALGAATGPLRCSLLTVCGALAGPKALAAMRAGMKDADAAVRDAACRALASTADPNAAPDLLALAAGPGETAHRVLAIRALVRLVEQTAAMPPATKLRLVSEAMAAAGRDEERKLVLGATAKLAAPEALKLVEPCLDNKATQTEALAACWQIARAIQRTHPQQALAACRRIVQLSRDRRMVGEAQRLIQALDKPPARP